MVVSDVDWSQTEKEVAQAAFSKAYRRETESLLTEVREQANTIAALEHLWQLHDFLSAKRHTLDGKYDYRYPVLVFVFAQLVKEGWLRLQDLDGLDAGKLAKIAALSRM